VHTLRLKAVLFPYFLASLIPRPLPLQLLLIAVTQLHC